jgi:hypothetical protein
MVLKVQRTFKKQKAMKASVKLMKKMQAMTKAELQEVSSSHCRR